MKVKAVEIARALGISKATVSLALNNKPGVSQKTREEIFACREQLSKGIKVEAGSLRESTVEMSHPGKQIKIILPDRHLNEISHSELDLWTDVNAVFEKCFLSEGYTIGLMYPDFCEGDLTHLYRECNADYVAGVIVIGTELREEDLTKLRPIQKPLVLYDCKFGNCPYPECVIDNRQGIALAVSELCKQGKKDIVFLGNSIPMYNFYSRTRGFKDAMERYGLKSSSDQIVMAGQSIRDNYLFMKQYFKTHHLPDAFIMDDYHVSIGTVQALLECGYKIPEDVSLAGVDMLPAYMTGGLSLSQVRVPHTEKAYWAVQLLLKEIRNPAKEKASIYVACEWIDGETIAKG